MAEPKPQGEPTPGDAENQHEQPPSRPPSDLSAYKIKPAEVVADEARKLLVEWSGIPADQVDQHVSKIREKAFKIHPYPCIGMYRFLDLSILTLPGGIYQQVLYRLKDGQTLLDLGCCFGQEVRQLAFDGAPSENLYGSDLRQEFMDLGYDLFHDRDKLKSTFISADVFNTDSDLKQLEDKIDIIYTGSFFHLFDWDEQFAVAKRIVSLLKPVPGSALIGRQVGNMTPGVYTRRGYPGERKRYRHNAESWKEMWEKVGAETGTKWRAEADMDEFGNGFGELLNEGRLAMRRWEPGTRRLRFVVTRL